MQMFSNPQFLLTGAGAPSAAVSAGTLYYDLTNKLLYQYDGASWGSILSNIDDLATQQLQQAIAILSLQAGASAAASDYSTMFLDIFSDASGYDNTIDTTNSTAIFNTNLYEDSGCAHNVAFTSSHTGTQIRGIGFTPKTTGYSIVSVTKEASAALTDVMISTTIGAALATATFVGNVATFASPFALTANTEYYLTSTGENVQHRYTANQTFPLSVGSDTTWRYTSTINGTRYTTGEGIFNIVKFVLSPSSSNIVQTNALTTPSPTHYQLYSTIATTGTGAVTYDISHDNGAHYATNKSLNVKYVSANVGTQTIIKLKFANGTGTATASNYALMLWTT